ncbi:MAG: hypothetical protein MK066_13260 [Crocinitomicaceae bacterium]|nr:hypothetical protein [Crocinitomicaceae bacterium]
MMKYCLYILFLVLSGGSTAQEVVETSLSSCDNKSYPEYIRNRLIEKEVKDDTLFLNVGLVLNCCPSPTPKLTYRNDSLFLEIIDNSEIWCACECCFELQIKATGIADTNFTLIHQFEMSDFADNGFIDWTEYHELKQYRNKYIFPSQEKINEAVDINQKDSLGRKIGTWYILYDNSNKVKYRVNYVIDENGESKADWSVRYSEEGIMTEICAKTGVNEVTCADKYDYDKIMIDKP